MEYNKDEAIRAKELAEKKMRMSDFIGAQKLALQAHRLFPALENISQLITVCDVHCSAQSRIYESERDWYRILRVEQLADEGTIRKQYRKLAFLLHPDKNKFAGAEAAFKLVGEANRLLTDPVKRSQYDMKYKATGQTARPKPPPCQPNRYSAANMQQEAKSRPLDASSPQFTDVYAAQSPVLGVTFFTLCRYCGSKQSCLRDCVNRVMRCLTCDRFFVAYDLNPQTVTLGPASKNYLPKQDAFPNQRFTWGPEQCEGGPVPHQASKLGHKPKTFAAFTGKEELNTERAGMRKNAKPRTVAGSSRTDPTNPESDSRQSKAGATRSAAEKKESNANGTSATSKKKSAVAEESNEHFVTVDSENENEEVTPDNRGKVAAEHSRSSGKNSGSRSLRQKQHVSYKEDSSDDDFMLSPPSKRSKQCKSSVSNEKGKEGAAKDGKGEQNFPGPMTPVDTYKKVSNQNGSTCFDGSKPNKKRGSEGCEESQKEGDKKIRFDPRIICCPDPEFNDFDADRAASRFAVNQVWAVYDQAEGLPRYYARVKKVFSEGFKLRITWLEADPDNQEYKSWVDAELPVACGRYVNGGTQETEDRMMFSHKIRCLRGHSRGSWLVLPRRGEIWALFKDWELGWSSEPLKHRPLYQYEIVQVLSGFVKDVGVDVAYMERVKGYVSIFRRSDRIRLHIPAKEQYRFSHGIPYCKITGSEKEGVPAGCFELDPASLPTYFYMPGSSADAKMENKNSDTENADLCKASCQVEKNINTRKKPRLEDRQGV